MENLRSVIDNMIDAESKRASNCVTRGTLKLRVLLKIAHMLGVTLRSLYGTRDSVYMDPDVTEAVEFLWKGGSVLRDVRSGPLLYLRCGGDDDDDQLLVERFLATDFTRPVDLLKIASVLTRRFEGRAIHRELWFLFAADGLLLLKEDDDQQREGFDRYFEHLAYPISVGERPHDDEDDDCEEDPIESHVRAVRTLYRDVIYLTPRRLGTTLRRLMKSGEKEETFKKKRRGDSRSTVSSESSSSESSNSSSSHHSSGDDSEHDVGKQDERRFDRYVADLYQRLVGPNMKWIAEWLRMRCRKKEEEEREEEEKNKARKLPKRKPEEIRNNDSTDPKIKRMSAQSEHVEKIVVEMVESIVEATAEPDPAAAAAAAVTTKKVEKNEAVLKPKKKKERKNVKNDEKNEEKKRKKSSPKRSKKIKTDNKPETPSSFTTTEKDKVLEKEDEKKNVENKSEVSTDP